MLRIVCLVTLLASAQSAQSAAIDDLRQAEAAWQGAAIADYEYGYNKYCDCHRENPPETLVTVSANAVVNVRHRPQDSDRIVPAEPRNFPLYWTIDDLFVLVESALSRDAVVRADYDRALGYPTSIYIDYDAALIGDEVDVRITRFTRQAD